MSAKFITGEKFIGVGDFVYSLNAKEDCNKVNNTFCICAVKERNIIYTHTMYVKQLFEEIRGLKSEFIVVTHNCDEQVDFEPPNNVIKWFAQNVAIEHPCIESIPIGLENDRWVRKIHKQDKMLAKMGEPRKYKNLLYIDHNITNYPSERLKPYQLLEGMPWVTSMHGTPFDIYINNIYNHNYVICPRGNGIDTHRMWECLYMGTIPIVVKNINNWFYNDMPILYVNDWEEVTEKLLRDMLPTFKNGKWNWKKLTFDYWESKIKKYAA